MLSLINFIRQIYFFIELIDISCSPYNTVLFYAAKAGLADFIQPSLGPLQPNLDDIMDIEDPLQG